MPLNRYPRPLLVGALAWAAVVWALTAFRAFSFQTGAFDLGYFVHALGTTALHGPFAPVPMTGVSLLGDHLSPLLIPIAPVALLPGAAYWLLAIQAGALGASIVLVWRLAMEVAPGLAMKAAALYAFCPALLYAAWNDFHASTLALPFLGLWMLGVLRRDVRQMAIGATLAILCREDIALSLGLIGLYLAWKVWRPVLYTAVPGLIVGVGYFLVGGGTGWLTRAGLRYLVEAEGFSAVGDVLGVIWSDGMLLVVIGALWIPWRLLGPQMQGIWIAYGISMLPLLALDVPNVHTVGLHYYVVGAMVGPAALRQRTEPQAALFFPTVLGLLLITGPLGASSWTGGTVGNSPAHVVIREGVSRMGENIALHALIESVPDRGVTVSVVQNAVLMMSPRNIVYPWPAPMWDFTLGGITRDPIVYADPSVSLDFVVAPIRARGFFRPELPSGFLADPGVVLIDQAHDVAVLKIDSD